MEDGIDSIGVTLVYFCHDGSGNFVMAKRRETCRDEWGRWDIGGGALKHGEYVKDALRREIQEEYNTNIINYEFLGFRDVHRQVRGDLSHWIALDFKVLVDKNLVKIGEPEKFEDIGWFQLDTLPKPYHSQFPAFLGNYKDRLS